MKKLLLAILAVFPLLTYAAGFDANEFNSGDFNFVGDFGTHSIDFDDGLEHCCKCIPRKDIKCSIINGNELYDSENIPFWVFITQLHPTLYRIMTVVYDNNADCTSYLLLEAMRNQDGWTWYNSKMQKLDEYNDDPMEHLPGLDSMYVRQWSNVCVLFENLPCFVKWMY